MWTVYWVLCQGIALCYCRWNTDKNLQLIWGRWFTVVVWHWLTGGICFVVDDWQLLCGLVWQDVSVLWWMIDSYCVALIDRRHLKCAVWAFIHLVTSCLSALIIPHVCFQYCLVMLCCSALIIAMPQKGAEYCDEWSVCLCTTTTCQNFTKFSIQVTRGCDRSVSNYNVFPVVWMTSVFT